ncbi:MAG: rRNA adenine dimethylase [Deltaproteobacteria bacterium]|nr:rRNA adenine dimethylase [Deltaproteobacteria bacterium]
MKQMLEKFTRRIETSGLVEPGGALFGMADDRIVWNRTDPAQKILEPLFSNLNINSVLFARPAFPYSVIIDFLAKTTRNSTIMPDDCETRTFLHDLPVADAFSALKLNQCLKARKSVIVPGGSIVTTGTISPEQALVAFSSVCFACFVKFFSDFLKHVQTDGVSKKEARLFSRIAPFCAELRPAPAGLVHGPFSMEDEIRTAMAEAGKKTVEAGLVDSSFGNISCFNGKTLYISQTGAFLNKLEGFIDPVPTDGSRCTGITASSELGAHLNIISATKDHAILHGHPLFSVIMSMVCDIEKCEKKGECHKSCPYDRNICQIPIVSGEVGAGPHGLCNTVACRMNDQKAVIVYGHGVFTTGKTDFNDALSRLYSIENDCRNEYFRRVRDVIGDISNLMAS